MKGLEWVISATMLVIFCGLADAQDGVSGYSCSLRIEACGALEQKLSPLTRLKAGQCLQLELAEIGDAGESSLRNATRLFIGAKVAGDTLVFGSGEATTGFVIECVYGIDQPKPSAQIESLKKALPELVRDKRFAEQFPGIVNVDASALKEVKPADDKCAEAASEFCKRN